jgi:signal transduction histidine kinase
MTASSPAELSSKTDKNASPKKDRSLVEAELVSSVAWLIRLRWLAGIGVLLASGFVSLVFPFEIQQGPLYIIGLGILAYNLIFYLIERRLTRSSAPATNFDRLAKWQVGLDWLAMTLLIHFSGGIESPVLWFFIFHIVIASIFFPPRTAYLFALFAVGLVICLTLLEYFGVLQHWPISGYIGIPLYQNIAYVTTVLLFFTSTSLITAYLASSIHERLRQREQEIVELTRNLRRATNRLQALNDGARAVGSTLELPQVLNRLVESTALAMGVRACSIRLLDITGRKLDPVAVYGLSKAYLEKGPVDPEDNPLAREVLSGKVVNVPDAPKSPLIQYPEEARQEGIRSMLSAPLIGKDGPLGILRAYAVEPNRFTPEDEQFLAAIAAQGSIAIENAIAYQAIEALDATKSQFIRTVTHELRSPVSVAQSLLKTVVTGYAGQVSEQQKDILNRAVRRIEFLQTLVDDLLDLAAGKAEAKEHELRETIDLRMAIEQVVDRFRVSAVEKDLVLEFADRSPNQPIVILATVDGLDRILDNVISNAIKYTPPGGRVTVSLSGIKDAALVTVEDTGIGIPESAMEHLFEEFYRAPNARALEQQGTGLGLVIVKDLVSRFSGRIAVHSTPNIGTRFTVTLPLAAPEAVETSQEALAWTSPRKPER